MDDATDRPRLAVHEAAAVEWVTMAEATRLAGRHETTILRAALAGQVRYRRSGLRILYHSGDVGRLAD